MDDEHDAKVLRRRIKQVKLKEAKTHLDSLMNEGGSAFPSFSSTSIDDQKKPKNWLGLPEDVWTILLVIVLAGGFLFWYCRR